MLELVYINNCIHMNLFFSSPQFMIGMSIVYLVTIKDLQIYMENKSAYSLKTVMRLYNIGQIFINLYMMYGLCMTPFMPEKPNLLLLNVPYTDRIAYFIDLHYISKYFDYFDTFFMVLRKKDDQVSFLHVYHHTAVCFAWGILVHMGHGNGTACFVALCNSFIHTIMYSHYLFTSLGYRNPYKKLITQAQIVQFILFITHGISVLLWETIYPRPLAFIELIFNFHLLTLFGDFYLHSYNKKQIQNME